MKTAHRDFPKDELLAAVDDIKGKSAEARAARQRPRGTQLTFTQGGLAYRHPVSCWASQEKAPFARRYRWQHAPG
eukprot:124453-Pleurochrysis_carterae.AAC.1